MKKKFSTNWIASKQKRKQVNGLEKEKKDNDMTPYAAYVKNKGKKSKVKIALDTGKDESGRDTSKKIKVKFNPKKNKLVKKVISTKKAKRNKHLEIVEPWERTKTKTVKYLGSDKKDKVSLDFNA